MAAKKRQVLITEDIRLD